MIRRHFDWKSNALPTELHSHKIRFFNRTITIDPLYFLYLVMDWMVFGAYFLPPKHKVRLCRAQRSILLAIPLESEIKLVVPLTCSFF